MVPLQQTVGGTVEDATKPRGARERSWAHPRLEGSWEGRPRALQALCCPRLSREAVVIVLAASLSGYCQLTGGNTGVFRETLWRSPQEACLWCSPRGERWWIPCTDPCPLCRLTPALAALVMRVDARECASAAVPSEGLYPPACAPENRGQEPHAPTMPRPSDRTVRGGEQLPVLRIYAACRVAPS